MKQALRILHVEDDRHDRELAEATLRADGIECRFRYVDSRPAFEEALVSEPFDLILADYSLPEFDGLTAQAIAKRVCPQTPFIFLSATLGEELAIERLKDGATDYVLKQRMARLPSAVRRAQHEAAERSERRLAEEEVRRLNSELEARVADRTAALAEATEALERREVQLREFDQLLEAIFDASPMAISVKDARGRYMLVSRRGETNLGHTRAEILGKTDHDVLPPLVADVVVANDRAVMREKHPMQFEEPAIRPDGLGVLSSTRYPLLDTSGKVYAVCCISEDITKKKDREDELRLAKLEAQRANLAKSHFLSRMSHDLRTPLNAILGFAQLLDLEELGPERVENVQQILAGGRHLLELIDEVLDITRIETGHLSLSLEPVLVHGIVDRTVALVRPLATRHRVTLQIAPFPDDAAVMADPKRLGQVLINLLGNAVKYNREGGTVTVGFVAPVEAGRPARVTVRDTGAGIAPEKLKLLFQPFERLGAEHSTIEGTGLGLALSRGLAQAMGGTLGVNSVVDEGSTFWVELPGASTPDLTLESRHLDAPVLHASPRTGTILYVEDNEPNVRLMQRILRLRPGLALIHAPTGAEAIVLARERRPDVILLDLHLPDTTGDQVLRQLWENPVTRRIPAVIVTADATPGLLRQLKAAGARACLTKPIEVAEVLQTLDDLSAPVSTSTKVSAHG